jgi:predicted membrane chloride channel (bestrophin family)
MHLLTGPVMGAIAWLMLGVYQIGYMIEEPFQGSLRLRVLCDAIYRDVMSNNKGGLINRESAFVIEDEEMDEWSKMSQAPTESEFAQDNLNW